MGCWAILAVGSASLPGQSREGGLVLRSRGWSDDRVNGRLGERGLLLRRQGWSGGRVSGRPSEGGLARRSYRPSSAFAKNRPSEGGFSLVETSITLFLLMTIASFGLQTMTSAWMLENSSIVQSMTDAQAAIETAYAQRWVFAAIPSSDVEANPDPTKTNSYTLWPVYPASSSVALNIGQTPAKTITATVVRTCHSSTDPVTGAQSYLLESYVTYKDGLRQYCKVSKVYRSQ